MAGHHHARVAERAAFALRRAAIHERDVVSLARGVIGDAEAHYSAADDEDALAQRPSRRPQARGSRSSSRRVASPVMKAAPVIAGTMWPLSLRVDLEAADEHAAGDALLPPDLARAQLPVGVEAGELRARAGAAGRAIVGIARAEHEASAVRDSRRRGPEQLDVIHLRARGPSHPGGDERPANGRGVVGEGPRAARVPTPDRGPRRGRTSCRPRPRRR